MILVADDHSEDTVQMRRALYLLGLPSVGCSYRMAFYYLRQGLGDLVLLPRPASPHRPSGFCTSLRRRFPGVPSVMLAEHAFDGVEIEDPADLVIRAPYSPASAMRRLFAYLRENHLRDHGSLRVRALVHAVTNGGFYLDGVYVKLTDTECAILHVMLDRFPASVEPRTLLRLSARVGTAPRLSSLAPHISRLNKKFLERTERRVIGYHPSVGYYLSV